MQKEPTQLVNEPGKPALRFIDLVDIMPDPNQPRKYFNEIDDAELLESVRSQGILQSLLVRPIETADPVIGKANPKAKYLIVCGERRYRAALAAANLAVVPAIIRAMGDEEALDAQIVENLQRKDVHPLEEAMAFKALAARGLSQEEIGKRVGKGDRFIRARLVLCQLNKTWSELFLRQAIDLETALKLCRFSDDIQSEIFKEGEFTKADLGRKDLKITVTTFAKYKGDLAAACFDLKDKTLVPEMGACIGCRFNSQTAELFPGDGSPRCHNLKCFAKKTEAGFKETLKSTEGEDDLVLVKTGYRSEDDRVTEKIKKDGREVLGSEDYSERRADDPGSYEDWKAKGNEFDGGWVWDEDDSEEDNRRNYERAVKDYEREKKDIEKGLKSGKYKRALVVQGDDDNPKGKILVIEVDKRQYSRNDSRSGGADRMTPAQKVAAGKATITDLEAEIERNQQSIKKARENQADNVHKNLVDKFKAIPASKSDNTRPLNDIETKLLIIFMVEELGGFDELAFDVYDNDDDGGDDDKFAEALGMKPAPKKKGLKRWESKNKEMNIHEEKLRGNVWEFVSKMGDGHLALIFRRLLLKKLAGYADIPSMYRSGNAWIVRKMIEQWDGKGEGQIDIAAVEAEVKADADKRVARANERIKTLRASKKELEDKRAAKTAKKTETKPKPQPAKATSPEPKKGIPVLTEKGKPPVNDGLGTPIGDARRWPGSKEALTAAGLTVYGKFGTMADVINSFPKSDYSTYFLQGLAGNWPVNKAVAQPPNQVNSKKVPPNDAEVIIISSAEFIALLRISQRSLLPAELKYLDFQFPDMAAATTPEKCKEIVAKLIEFWNKQAAQANRKAEKETKKVKPETV
jgi:ParB/RepB/Spo0J family partition protein